MVTITPNASIIPPTNDAASKPLRDIQESAVVDGTGDRVVTAKVVLFAGSDPGVVLEVVNTDVEEELSTCGGVAEVMLPVDTLV